VFFFSFFSCSSTFSFSFFVVHLRAFLWEYTLGYSGVLLLYIWEEYLLWGGLDFASVYTCSSLQQVDGSCNVCTHKLLLVVVVIKRWAKPYFKFGE